MAAARIAPPDGASDLEYSTALVRIVTGRSSDAQERALADLTYRRVRRPSPTRFELPLGRARRGFREGELSVLGEFPRPGAPAGRISIGIVGGAVRVALPHLDDTIPGLGDVTVELSGTSDTRTVQSQLLTALAWSEFRGVAPVPLPDLATDFVVQPSFHVAQSPALAELAGMSRNDRSGQGPDLLRCAAIELGLVPDLDARGRLVLVAHLVDQFVTGSVSARDLEQLSHRAGTTGDTEVDRLLEDIAVQGTLWGDEYVGDAAVVGAITLAAAEIQAITLRDPASS